MSRHHLLECVREGAYCPDNTELLQELIASRSITRLRQHEGKPNHHTGSNRAREAIKHLHGRTAAQVTALESFAKYAEEEHLRFSVIKGIPLSQIIYGDSCSRASTDIDVLVSTEDLYKAHRVAERAGFAQPAETFRARQLVKAGFLDEDLLKALSTPFPIRNSPRSPHLAPYLLLGQDGSAVILEIHDSFHGLAPAQMGRFVWDVEGHAVGSSRIPAPRAELSFLLLLLAARDDSEGLRGNIGDGYLGMPDYLDLHNWMKKGAPLCKAAHLVQELGLTRVVGESVWNWVQLFPDDRATLAPFFSMYRSKWSMPYLERFEDVAARRHNARELMSAAARSLVAARRSLTRAIAPDESMARIVCTVAQNPQSASCLQISWDIPDYLGSWHEGVALWAVIFGSSRNGSPDARQVALWHQDGSWVAASSCFDICADGDHLALHHLVPLPPPLVTKTTMRVRIQATIETGTGEAFEPESLYLSLWKQVFSRIYHYGFGDDISSLTESALTQQSPCS